MIRLLWIEKVPDLKAKQRWKAGSLRPGKEVLSLLENSLDSMQFFEITFGLGFVSYPK
jgi:hypothetical protein